MAVSIKIPVKYYTEITETTDTNGIEFGEFRYITNEGGKQWIVEILA